MCGWSSGVPTCDDTWSLVGHDSLREASELLGQERRSGQRSEHRCSHRLLNAPQNIISTAVSNTTILHYRKHYIPLLQCTYRQKNYVLHVLHFLEHVPVPCFWGGGAP